MAFLSKIGNVLRQTANASKHISAESFAARPSIFQAIRCMSSSKLFIGGISYTTDDQSLGESFSKYGQVVDARVIVDRETGRSRGFGFVTYTSSEEASSAIQAMDGQELHGRMVRVNYANDRPRNTGGSDNYPSRGPGDFGYLDSSKENFDVSGDAGGTDDLSAGNQSVGLDGGSDLGFGGSEPGEQGFRDDDDDFAKRA
ncbi:hypothetical protein ACFE04_007308 [Oxalis oulophora]